jgi:phosphoadenosine phosphosulfate reductase
MTARTAERLDEKIETLERLLERAARDYAPVALASSFGVEDMVLTDAIARKGYGIGIFTLDTGRLPEETHKLMQETNERYGISVAVYFPKSESVERYYADHGANAFYRSLELRKACCHMRKVEPLSRALAGKKAWITGIRRDQAASRRELQELEFDADHGIHKFNPLIEWTAADVWAYIKRFEVPYNALHDRGYPSIGCAPCTRAITVGEDPRAGRWWWEQGETKECGLHERKKTAA